MSRSAEQSPKSCSSYRFHLHFLCQHQCPTQNSGHFTCLPQNFRVAFPCPPRTRLEISVSKTRPQPAFSCLFVQRSEHSRFLPFSEDAIVCTSVLCTFMGCLYRHPAIPHPSPNPSSSMKSPSLSWWKQILCLIPYRAQFTGWAPLPRGTAVP